MESLFLVDEWWFLSREQVPSKRIRDALEGADQQARELVTFLPQDEETGESWFIEGDVVAFHAAVRAYRDALVRCWEAVAEALGIDAPRGTKKWRQPFKRSR